MDNVHALRHKNQPHRLSNLVPISKMNTLYLLIFIDIIAVKVVITYTVLANLGAQLVGSGGGQKYFLNCL